MTLAELRYDPERALRYSDAPGTSDFEKRQQTLLTHYAGLRALRDTAKIYHLRVVRGGIFESVPTLTSETRKGRPGVFWRAVFSSSSPEVRGGIKRKHYIGSDEAKLQEWQDWIARTRLAMALSRLIDDIGNTLRHDCRTIKHTADLMAGAVVNYNIALEDLKQ